MPFKHGAYFSRREIYKAKEFLSTLGLSGRQANDIQAWHRYHLARQLTVWAIAGTCTGFAMGYLFAQMF